MNRIIALAAAACLTACSITASKDDTNGTQADCDNRITAEVCISCCEKDGFSGHNFFVDENNVASCTCEGTGGEESGL